MPQEIKKLLSGGDLRSIGNVEQVVRLVLKERELLAGLFELILSSDQLVRMRAADAVEKISRKHPDWLRPFKRAFLEKVMRIEQPEVRWHAAQMAPRFDWMVRERESIAATLFGWVDTARSSIVRTMALQALADLAEIDERFRAGVKRKVRECAESEIPALRSRGRKILKGMERAKE